MHCARFEVIRWTRVVAAALVCVVAPETGCAQSDEPTVADAQVMAEPETSIHTFIGALEDSETRIAIVRDGDALQAYVCGKGETLESHTRWFAGSLGKPNPIAAELAADEWTLRVLANAASMSGELQGPSGEVEHWTALRTDEVNEDGGLSEVGLYESHDTGCRSGVIVWEAIEGPDCGAQGAWCDESGVRGQVTPARCTAGEPLRVQGERDGVTFDLIAERVRIAERVQSR